MAYLKTNWANGSEPAINAENLNKIEQELYDLDNGLATANTTYGAVKTEVDDIRVGADGVTYSSAGDSVRAQVSGLSSDLKMKADNYTVKFFKHYSIASNGKISANNNLDVYAYKLNGASTILKYKTNYTSSIYAFYNHEPTNGSISYNQSRTVVENVSEITDINVPSGCEWVAFAVGTGYKAEIELAEEYLWTSNVDSEIENLNEKTDVVYGDIYYATPSQTGERANIYYYGDIGDVYTQAASSNWESIKSEANPGDKFKCVFTPKMSNTGSFDWILFVNSSNVILGKFSGNFRTEDSKTEYVTCPANTSYIIVNAFKYQDIINVELYPEINAITELQNSISGNDNGYISKGEILLPKIIDVAVGRQCNLYWSNIANIREKDASVYFEVMCDIGAETERGFIIQPDSTMEGNHSIKINARDSYSRRVINTYSGTVRVVNNSSLAAEKTMLMIGDSRTTLSGDGVQGTSFAENNNRMVTTETKALLDAAYSGQIKFIGTYSSPLDASVKNLAVSGWNTKNVIDKISDAGGIVSYVENDCGLGTGASLDVVTIMLGINDIGPWRGDAENIFNTAVAKIPTYITRIKSLIDTILGGYPNCRIFLILESTMCADQDGFGYFSDARYRRTTMNEGEQALKVLRKTVISNFDDSAYSNKVILSTAGIWCDRLYGFPYLIEHPSVRASVKEVDRFVNFLHPHNDGYKQIADGVYSSVVGLYQ